MGRGRCPEALRVWPRAIWKSVRQRYLPGSFVGEHHLSSCGCCLSCQTNLTWIAASGEGLGQKPYRNRACQVDGNFPRSTDNWKHSTRAIIYAVYLKNLADIPSDPVTAWMLKSFSTPRVWTTMSGESALGLGPSSRILLVFSSVKVDVNVS